MARGVVVAPIVLHTGVSSQESHEPPQPEQFVVPEATARLVNGTRAAGRRVVAVGTTVVRALETVATGEGGVHRRGDGWTVLVLGPRAAGARGRRAAHRSARAGGQPPRPAARRWPATAWSTGPTTS